MEAPKASHRALPKAVGESRCASRRSEFPSRQESRLTPREVEDFQQRLLGKRRELIDDVRGLRSEAANGIESGSNSMPIHMADRGSDTWEQGLTFRLTETQETVLREIDVALQRMRDGVYGICEATGKRISETRLRAVPWTRYCIEYARKLEAEPA
jgi:RNA polymerase-binding transcription factor DksA